MATLNAEKLFPYTMRSDTRIKGFSEGIGQMFDDKSDVIDSMNIYDFANVPEAVLDGFAKDRKVRGYEFCADAAEKRALLSVYALLKRRSGTIWAVQTILETFGFTNVIIWENATAPTPIATGVYKANAWVKANGTLLFNNYFFKVSADDMTGNEAKATQLILHYKDAKSYLLEVYNNII